MALGHICIWQGVSLEADLQGWITNPSNRPYKALPLILGWGI